MLTLCDARCSELRGLCVSDFGMTVKQLEQRAPSYLTLSVLFWSFLLTLCSPGGITDTSLFWLVQVGALPPFVLVILLREERQAVVLGSENPTAEDPYWKRQIASLQKGFEKRASPTGE